jgi:DNA-binding NarL/FixJ family response regulator
MESDRHAEVPDKNGEEQNSRIREFFSSDAIAYSDCDLERESITFPSLDEVTAKRIYIVEDENMVLEVLMRGLKMEGYKDLTPFKTVRPAIETIEQLCPDVLVTDINVNGGNGAEVVQKLFEVDSGTPVIVMTGIWTPENIKPFIDLHADLIVRKVSKFGMISDVIHHAVLTVLSR